MDQTEAVIDSGETDSMRAGEADRCCEKQRAWTPRQECQQLAIAN